MSALQPDAENIFGEAVRLTDPAQRKAYLDEACRGDEALRREVDSLLAAHADERNFLTVRLPLAGGELPQEQAGHRIGRYKLMEQIGEGGFGTVWMAEQEEPVRRRVALKIIKLGMDTKEVVARFEAERQALPMMDHPNIARVFDGGATDTGRPYFVMELVRGVPITNFCDAKKLSTRERLELFMQVCQAVQHAHQKGVIHRDLKPSNILVTVQDDRPVPKVIDFGVAKATQARLTDKTVFTRFHQWMGTPAYMSPEQAGLGSFDIDTRSDVYSLGVLLYELLTGRPPFDTQQLLAAGYDAVLRTIREEEPPKPSTRLSTLTEEDLCAVAASRSAEPAKLSRLVRGELDWIVMRALEKDRGRRYETASHLAMEIERHLNFEPVLARSPSNYYRFRKWIRRHKSAVIVATSVSVCLLMVALVLFELVGGLYFFQPARYSYHLYASFANAQNLRLHDRVRVSGVPVGLVQGISLDSVNGKVRVTMAIDRNVALKTDTVATIRPDSAGRRGFVELTLGSPNAPTACEGACLLTGEEGSFDSNYPFYHAQDLVFEPGLIGGWTATKTDARWKFEQDGQSRLRVTREATGKTNVFQGYAFRLGGEPFLDLSSTGWRQGLEPEPAPLHWLAHVVQLTPTLKLSVFNYAWLKSLLAEDPKALRHLLVHPGDNPAYTRIVLTSDTAELQRFVLKHLKTERAWETAVELKPQPGASLPVGERR